MVHHVPYKKNPIFQLPYGFLVKKSPMFGGDIIPLVPIHWSLGVDRIPVNIWMWVKMEDLGNHRC